MRPGTLALALVIVGALGAQRADAGQAAARGIVPSSTAILGLPAFDGPPAPEPPAVVSRDADGRATVRAVRLPAPLRIDGRLDEPVYENSPSVSDFIQQEPAEGTPASEKTDVWVFFDRDSIYVVGRCWDSHPERMIANEMRRDGSRIPRNENFAFSLDTFYDRRNGFSFELTPVGGRWDGEVANDGATISSNPNPIWEVATGRFDRGWVVEARIPFKSLRYRAEAAQVWGFQVRRMVRWKNEISYISRIPASIGERGHHRVSLSPSLIGLEVPPGAKNLEIKPYAVANLASDVTAVPRLANELDGNLGGDVKYGITKSLTADFTYNTDFAQVEADLQQVNLTRFSLFFPEKREFFLENSGLFTFGGATGTDNTPALFYSRRIGLSGSEVVPIIGGGRLTGRIGKFTLGALNIEADDKPIARIGATNFSAIRVRRDILRRSSVGGIYTRRSIGQNGGGANDAYGVDGTFILTNTVTVTTFWAKTRSPDVAGDDTSYRALLDFAGDRYGVQAERLRVASHFNPEIGFVRRSDLRRSFGLLRFSPRPRARSPVIRKYYYIGTLEYIENGAGRVETRTGTGEFAIDFQNSDRFNLKYARTYEFLPVRLPLAPGVVVPVGGYEYASVLGGYNFGSQRKVAVANVSVEHGSFYGGHKTTGTVSNGLVSLPPHLMVEPTYSVNRVRLPEGSFTTHLVGPRVTYTVTPPMFVSGLIQFNSTTQTVSANVRFRWEYQPGSELFVVWNEQRDTSASSFPELQNRALIVKVNRLFRY